MDKGTGGIGYDTEKTKYKGESCSHNILAMVAYGDSSIEAAKRNNPQIQKVSYYDKSYMNIFGLYGSICTQVYGR